ncbi:DgyrCDS7766 [Dimorphilus gyrociliatus]|uniref:DgyrCDS7766 n=1 Tax=Dimorphilus gyrociliatus TaxID=2664684 RepID=A0A7I8VUL1_9ANNE|nr:DgyrCDS7766 [Dimorphilus gyrociliatus]
MADSREDMSRENTQEDVLVESSRPDNEQIPLQPSNESIVLEPRSLSQQFVDYSNRLIQPRSHRAKILVWADLTVNDMDLLEGCKAPDDIKRELCTIFQLTDGIDPEKTEVLLDLYYYAIIFSRENSFSKAQTSALISIIKATHDVCTETPFGNVNETFSYFKDLILCHSVKRPPFSINLFDAHQVRLITDYMLNTYFRHYKMYKYAFTPLVRLDLGLKYIGMKETPPPSEKADEESVKDDEKEEVDVEEPKPDEEESPAASELRSLIKMHLTTELKRVQNQWEERLQESIASISGKVDAAEDKGRKSGKGKRK